MEGEESLTKLCIDSTNLNVLCAGLLEQSGWSHASNVSSRACPVPEQLKFKPEAMQLHWFSVQTASWSAPGLNHSQQTERDKDKQGCRPGGSDSRLKKTLFVIRWGQPSRGRAHQVVLFGTQRTTYWHHKHKDRDGSKAVNHTAHQQYDSARQSPAHSQRLRRTSVTKQQQTADALTHSEWQ